MTPEELAAIEARANAATLGPWTWAGSVIGIRHLDAEFIAEARSDIQRLIADVRRLQAQIPGVVYCPQCVGSVDYCCLCGGPLE